MNNIFKSLDAIVADGWKAIREGGYWQFCMNNKIPVELYSLVMLQIYHYTRFNSINQAAAAYSAKPEQAILLRFVYKHAAEELGHENMVIRDLESVNAMPAEIPAPLAPTQALIGYLNDVSLRVGPIARLGYSYWAEDSYDVIQPMLDKFRLDLGLKDENMTFFVAHSTIDAKHSQEVHDAIEKTAHSNEDRRAMIEVARVTLYLTGQLLEESFREYARRHGINVTKAA